MLETGKLQISVSLSVADGGRAVLWRTTKDDCIGVGCWQGWDGSCQGGEASWGEGGTAEGKRGGFTVEGTRDHAKDRCVWEGVPGRGCGSHQRIIMRGSAKVAFVTKEKQIKTYVLSRINYCLA